MAYWVSEKVFTVFGINKAVNDYGAAKEGITTGDNEKTLRFWFEVNRNSEKLGSNTDVPKKWNAMYKGGDFRRWYGNMEYVVLWGANGELLKNSHGSVLRSQSFYGKPAVWWTYITSGSFSVRIANQQILHNTKGPACYIDKYYQCYFLGLFNSKVVDSILKIIAPTVAKKPGDVAKIPVIECDIKKEQVDSLVRQNISLSKSDWDAFETSWDFKRHPLI